MHRAIATIALGDPAAVAAELRALPAGVDAAEVRLDALWPETPHEEAATDALLAIAEAGEAAGVPLVATLRPTRHGGAFLGAEEVRLGLLAAAARAGFAEVDLELDAALVPEIPILVRSSGAGVLPSHHLRGAAPCRDDGLRALTALQDVGGSADKLAFEASAWPDLLRALELARAHAQRGGRPAVATLGMGGADFRALLALAGNQATYGHSPGAPPAVPGQPALADAEATWRRWGVPRDELGVARPWLALVGTPVAHALSPRIHNAALRAAGRPERMGHFDVPASAGALRLLLHVADRIGLAGASITMPHKVDAARLARCDPVAAEAGAANCLRFTPAGPEATNTDATALLRLLAPARGRRAVVLGAGGAARAALWALGRLGTEAWFTSRGTERARAVAAATGARWVPWERRDTLRADAWVQATPLGMRPGDASPVLPAQVRQGGLVVELPYGPAPTALEQAALRRGAAFVGGRTLLVEQAVDAFRFWTGQEPSRGAMATAAGIEPPTPLAAT
jgi:shikimate dehydrogenase